LIIPSALAYGAAGVLNQQTRTYNIPPYAPLVFEIRHTKTQRTRMLDYIKLNAWTDTVRTASGLYTRIETAVPDANRKAVDTDSVQVRITAQYLMTNEVLSAPFFTDEFISFRLNKSEADTNNKELIAGLREGIILMREGERRRLIIPSGLAFGEKGKAGKPVPGKTPVVYIVELIRFF
jgi:FKBP-type peptidyl-prolyl cis-trans isomerase